MHYIGVFVLGFPLSFYWLSGVKWIRIGSHRPWLRLLTKPTTGGCPLQTPPGLGHPWRANFRVHFKNCYCQRGRGGGRTIFICNYFFWGGGGKVLIHHSFFVLIVRDVLFFKQELKQHFNFHCENYWFFLSPLNRKALDTREASFTESLVILWSKVILFTHSNLSLITLPVCQVEYVWCLNDKYLFSFIGGDFTNGDGTGGMEFLHSVNWKFRT